MRLLLKGCNFSLGAFGLTMAIPTKCGYEVVLEKVQLLPGRVSIGQGNEQPFGRTLFSFKLLAESSASENFYFVLKLGQLIIQLARLPNSNLLRRWGPQEERRPQ